MFTRRIKAGATDVSVVLRVIDSADGTPETGVDHATSGLDLKYRREGAANVDITEAALAALTTAHTDGGVEQIGNGYIRVDLPDAACASGVSGVMVHGVATGMVIIGCYIELVAHDPYTSGAADSLPRVDDISTDADIAAAVHSETVPGAYGAGTAGNKIGGLNYTVANVLDANVQRINDVVVTGDGVSPKFGV